VPKAVALTTPLRDRVDVVLEHQLLSRIHRRLRLVQVRTFSERQKLRDPLQNPCAFFILFRRWIIGSARRRRIDPELLTNASKRRPMRRLINHAQDLVHVLMRHFVLQHFHDHSPRSFEHQLSTDLDRARLTMPSSEITLCITELDRRAFQAALKIRRIDVLVDRTQFSNQGGFEFDR